MCSLIGVLILLLAGALAVIYAQNITAGDIGIPTTDEKHAAINKERDKIDARLNEIDNGPQRACVAALKSALDPWPTEFRFNGQYIEGSETVPTGNEIIEAVEGYFSQHPDVHASVPFTVVPKVFCADVPFTVDPITRVRSGGIPFGVAAGQLAEFKSLLSGKSFFDEKVANALRNEIQTLLSRRDSMAKIDSQNNLEKLEIEVGIMKQIPPPARDDLFLRLVQTSVTRFGLLAVTGFFVSILVSLYRYNVRLAPFYTARADALRLLEPPSSVSDFALIVTALSPTVEFGRGPQPPIAQLVDLVKAAKDSAK